MLGQRSRLSISYQSKANKKENIMQSIESVSGISRCLGPCTYPFDVVLPCRILEDDLDESVVG